MKTETFAELIGSMQEALAHSRGTRDLRTTVLPGKPAPMNGSAIKDVRKKFHASQSVFASYLNVSTKLVQAWEGGRRHPDGAALVLLHIAAKQPAVIEALRGRISKTGAPKSEGRRVRA